MFKRNFIPLIMAVFLTACGGGGGGGSSNSAPTISGQPVINVNESTLYSFTPTVHDDNGDSLSFSISNLPTWAEFDTSTGTLSGQPDFDTAGEYADITISVSDGQTSVSLPAFTIEVVNSIGVQGVVVDGYISGAIVYLDKNLNKLQDEDEPSTRTDNEGAYQLLVTSSDIELLNRVPLRAYIGEGAVDLDRPELDFSLSPLTMSLSPFISVDEFDTVLNDAVINPFTNELSEAVELQLQLLSTGELPLVDFQVYLNEKKAEISAKYIEELGLLNELALGEEEDLTPIVQTFTNNLIFGDYLAYQGNSIPDTVEDLESKLVTLINNVNQQAVLIFDEAQKVQDIRDTDEDGITDSYDAFPEDPAESVDTDQDGSGNNADEDDDGDGLSDEDELNLHNTDPLVIDTDLDGLSDGEEVNTFSTSPLKADTDGDTVSDGMELNYQTDPNDSSDFSMAVAWFENFETQNWTNKFTSYGNDNTDWLIQDSGDGRANVLRSGRLGGYDESVVYIAQDLPKGTISFDVKVDITRDGSYFYLMVNRNSVLQFTGDMDWQRHTIVLDEDVNTVYFVYEIEGYRYESEDVVMIDNVNYVSDLSLTTDEDEDGLPLAFEYRYALSDVFAGDVLLDNDNDGLTNLMEFQYLTNPLSADSDGDTLSDYDEIEQFFTAPTTADSDEDGLNDNEELSVTLTDPLNADSDGDLVRDGLEVEFNSNPLDASSTADVVITWFESFEGESLPSEFSSILQSKGFINFAPETNSDGEQSLVIAAVSMEDFVTTSVEGVFEQGFLSFDARLLNDDCCTYMEFYINGRFVQEIEQSEWNNFVFYLEAGQYTLDWVVTNGNYQGGIGIGYIDNIRFESGLAQQTDNDGDGLSYVWESEFGLSDNDREDAFLDNDGDGLTNAQEHDYKSNPLRVDTDFDGVNDIDEVNQFGTLPYLRDTDSDGLWDGDEIENILTSPTELDSDGDGFSDGIEIQYGSDPLDTDSITRALSWSESFEQDTLPQGFSNNVNNNTNWRVTDEDSYEGQQSLFGQIPSAGSYSEISYVGYFEEGYFWLNSKRVLPETYNCCVDFSISVDGEPLFSGPRQLSESRDWNDAGYNSTFLLAEGQHTITFRIENHSADEDFSGYGIYIDSVFFYANIGYDLDQDNDGIPLLFERRYGLSDTLPADALDDNDSDGLSNLEEHQFRSLPNNPDSDSDGLSDGDEVKVYFTEPSNPDSDYDGLSDSEEVLEYMTSPREWDTDDDEVNDGLEIKYGSDPNDAESDNSLDAWFESFEDEELSQGFNNDISNTEMWSLTNGDASVGNQSLSAINEDYDSSYAVSFIGLFKAGELFFDVKITDAYTWADNLRVRVNDYTQLYISETNGDWQRFSIRLDAGEHEIKWLFGQWESQGRVFIDNIEFISDYAAVFDGDVDGLPLAWELKHGLDDQNADDANGDLDTDLLTNIEEFTTGTNPQLADTDEDGLSDGEEVNDYSTLPLNPDSDDDGLQDGEEVNNYQTLPMVADTDGDGVSDGLEIYLDTDPLDEDSVLLQYLESFEIGVLSAFWSQTSPSEAAWYIDTHRASDGTKSLRSGSIGDHSSSSMTYTVTTVASALTFDAYVSTESCCDYLEIIVNNVMQRRILDNREWENINIPLSDGVNTITFTYIKDGSVSSGEDAVWVDNIEISPLEP